jgi:hypothetical protein
MHKRFGSDEEIEKQVSDRTRINQEDEEWTFCYDANYKAVGMDCFFLRQTKGDPNIIKYNIPPFQRMLNGV